MAQQVRSPGAIAPLGLVSGHRLHMAGVHEDHFHKACEDGEDRLPGHPGTLNGHMGAALLDKPIRQAPSIISHGRERATCLLLLLEEARYHGLGVHVETTATLIPDLHRVLLAATA